MTVDSLTTEQEKEIGEYVARGLERGRSTEPADRPRAEAGVKAAYEERGLEPPRLVFWARGPMEGCAMAALVGKALESKSGDHQLNSQLSAQLWTQLRTQLSDQLSGKDIQPRLRQACYGQHDLYFLYFYKYIRDVLGCTSKANPDPAIEVAEASGWWWPYKGYVVLSERPETLKLDDAGQMHCEDGPAVGYGDGFKGYYWHGTEVPDEWIENPKSLDPATAITWENIEQRRCAAEIVGWDKVLNHIGARTIDQDLDPHIGSLIECDLPDSPGERFLRVKCGTGRTFAIPVPPDITTAIDAQVWMHPGLDIKTIREIEIRT